MQNSITVTISKLQIELKKTLELFNTQKNAMCLILLRITVNISSCSYVSGHPRAAKS